MTDQATHAEQAKQSVLAEFPAAFAKPVVFVSRPERWAVSRGPGQSYLALGHSEDHVWVEAARTVAVIRQVNERMQGSMIRMDRLGR